MCNHAKSNRQSDYIAVFRSDQAPACSCSERLNPGALGIDAKYVVGTPDATAQKSRKTRYQMQRRAAWLLPQHRVGKCRWTVQCRDKPVELTRHAEGYASYAGLQTCGSVWSCPICASRISEQRRGEMNHVLAWAREEGHMVRMLTLTCRHGQGDSLAAQLAGMKAALRKLRQRKAWRKVKAVALVGSITATEVTHGSHGWHTHFHIILILRHEPQPWKDRKGQIVDPWGALSDAWVDCLATERLGAVARYAFQVQAADQAGEYVAKWGAAEEIALQGKKRAKGGGRTPFELLHDFTFERDKAAGRRFVEFSKVFKGARQLVWSDKLKELAGVDEIEDEEAAGDGEGDEMVALIDHRQWVGDGWHKGVRTRRVRVLEAAERSNEAARLQIAIGTEDEEPEYAGVIDDETDDVLQVNEGERGEQNGIQSEPGSQDRGQEQGHSEQRYQAWKAVRVEGRQSLCDRCVGADPGLRLERRTGERFANGSRDRSRTAGAFANGPPDP